MDQYAVVLGSINIDLVATVEEMPPVGATISSLDFSTNQGGKGANQAVALASSGAPVYMLGKVGQDDFANFAKASLAARGVKLSHLLTQDQASTGTALILVDSHGSNTIVVNSGANGLLSCQDLDAHKELIQKAGLLVMQLEIPLEVVEYGAKLAWEAKVPVLLDPAPPRALNPSLLTHVTYLTPNQHEAGVLSGVKTVTRDNASAVAKKLLSMGPEVVLLKLGSEGLLLATEKEEVFIPGHEVPVVDTTGAGDCFAGAFAARILAGDEPTAAASYGNLAAALSVTRPGAATAPSPQEVWDFAQKRGVDL